MLQEEEIENKDKRVVVRQGQSKHGNGARIFNFAGAFSVVSPMRVVS